MENYYVNDQIEVNNCRRKRRRVSWGAIIAGTAVVLAVSMLLSILGYAIGMFIFNPTSTEPFSGIFGTVSIWTGVSILVGLACGGFVAGKLAGTDGFIHGFIVWSITMIAGVLMVGSLTTGFVKLTGNVLGAAESVILKAGSAIGDGISTMTNEAKNIFSDIDFDAEGEELQAEIRQALKRSGVQELQPEYLSREYEDISRELRKTINRAIANPQHADIIIDDFIKNLDNKIDKFAKKIDKEDIISLVANNSNLSRAEAENAVDQYMALLEQGHEKLNDLRQTMQEAGHEWNIHKEQLLLDAKKASNMAGWMCVCTFVILLMGAVATSFAGLWGMNKTKQGYEA